MNKMARLKQLYKDKLALEIKKKLSLNNIMEVPHIKKIILNMGIGESVKNKKVIEYATKDLALISGQKPIVTKAKKSIAGFKIRDGWVVGIKVTLRDNKMYEFLDRLISITLPRVRDFRGLSIKSFDGFGNYSLGIREQISFTEIDYEKVDQIRGLDIAIVTTATNDIKGEILLSAFNFPLKSKEF